MSAGGGSAYGGMANSCCFAALRTQNLHIGDIHGAFLGDNLSFLSLLARALVTLDRIQSFHDNPSSEYTNNLSVFIAVFACQHDYFVAFFNMHDTCYMIRATRSPVPNLQ